jgi:ribonuclease P protein subunit POP4
VPAGKGRRTGHSSWALFFGPLTGLHVCICFHPDPSLRHLCGLVVLEKPRCLIVESADGRRRCVLKRGGLFAFKLGSGGWALVRGEEVLGSPGERLRRLEKGKGVGWLVRASKRRGYTWCKAAREDL